MPRDLVLGNGRLLINYDLDVSMRDLYYPVVGLDNHILGYRCSISLWEAGNFSRLAGEAWEKNPGYETDTLITRVTARNAGWGLNLLINDAVHHRYDLLLRRVRISNRKMTPRVVRLFFNGDFSLFQDNIGDTVLFDPVSRGVVHFKRNLYLLMNGSCQGRGIFQYATGLKRFGGAEGTWRDAEDGRLEGNPIAHGSVDSTLSFEVRLPAGGEADVWYWIALGESIQAVRRLNDLVLEKKPGSLLQEIEVYWRHWVNRQELEWGDLPPAVAGLFRRSLLTIRTHCDNGGAILAATDSAIMATARDHYNYVWPRDAAMIALALDRAGYREITERFFELAARMLSDEGFYYQKYNPDGTLGSSWHPWARPEGGHIPLQEDETALVIYALGHHYRCFREQETLASLYHGLVKRAAGFLLGYRQPESSLPGESYDLWEERKGIFSFTTAAVAAGLLAAAGLAEIYGDLPASQAYRQGAWEIRSGLEHHLYSRELGRFVRGIYPGEHEVVADPTLDASLYGLFAFGVFSPEDSRVVRTMEAVEHGLKVQTEVGGLARYTGDWYFRCSEDLERVPGNPWLITTLWLGEWYTARARHRSELKRARLILEWVARHSLASGILPEQLHPYTGAPLSVAPLTWSHGAFVLAVLNYLERYRRLPG